MYYMIPNNMFTEICEKLEAELKRIIPKTSYYLGDRETVEYYEDTAALLIYILDSQKIITWSGAQHLRCYIIATASS